jgi:nucleotide-binding universal stress UspA family protein
MTLYFPPRTILTPTDLSENSTAALHFARMFRAQFGGTVRVLHSEHLELPPYFSSAQVQNLKREMRQATKGAAEYVRKESAVVLQFDPEVLIVDKPPAQAILEASAEPDVDLIVMGTHGRHGVNRLWLGSVAERVLRESSKPMMAVRQGMTYPSIAKIMCPVGLSAAGGTALEYAAALAKAVSAELTVIHSVETGQQPPDCPLVTEDLRERCDIRQLTYHGDAAASILIAVQEIKPDVIVMGAERRHSVLGDLFSSTTERVMQWGGVPLIVVPKS